MSIDAEPTELTRLESAKPRAQRLIEIVVNGKAVRVPRRVTGREIKAAAGVPPDFVLFQIKGRTEHPVEDDEVITVTKGDKFVASPTLDPSFVELPVHVAAVSSVQDTFPEHRVTHRDGPNGSVVVTLHDVEIGDGWHGSAIDISVKLQVSFPSTPPYPFYGPAGMRRRDGAALPPIQPAVDLDGEQRTQISLNKQFDPATETLGGRFAAVIDWLRCPR